MRLQMLDSVGHVMNRALPLEFTSDTHSRQVTDETEETQGDPPSCLMEDEKRLTRSVENSLEWKPSMYPHTFHRISQKTCFVGIGYSPCLDYSHVNILCAAWPFLLETTSSDLLVET